ncbi:hypothetical protein PTKIN_Ptkin19aG0039800 [Pterospermum kingtungense]
MTTAPQLFNFMKEESQEEIRQANLLFQSPLSYAPSHAKVPNSISEDKPQAELVPDRVKEEEVKPSEAKVELVTEIANDNEVNKNVGTTCALENRSSLTAKKIASLVGNQSLLKPKKGTAGTPNLALEYQTIEPQKLDGGRSRQIFERKGEVVDLFDKLFLKSEPSCDPVPRKTIPNPFHFQTEERGAEKQRKFLMEVIEEHLEEERARVPKANPYPCSTDYPVIPPKPEPKQCTKPEPFQLESLVRHEKEMQREMEERRKKEKEEAQMRIFKTQPIVKEDPIPVPEKVRKPLTQVQEFNLHVDRRAVDRAEFNQKIKEKEVMYKRYREESKAARMIEEEKALKQLRRTMIPHARPLPMFDHPFCPQKSSKETTKPKSPHLRVLQRKERRKMTLTAVT